MGTTGLEGNRVGLRNGEHESELEEAVRRARGGDEIAFGVVYATVQPILMRRLLRLVGPDAEDVAADSWLAIVRNLDRFNGPGTGFVAWAVTIARHRAVDHMRRRRSRPRTTLLDREIHDFPDHRDTAGEAMERISTERAVSLIAILPDRQARAVLLRTVIGLDTATTARLLRARRSDVRSATHRGLNGLAQYLALTGQTSAREPGVSVLRCEERRRDGPRHPEGPEIGVEQHPTHELRHRHVEA